MFGTGEADGMVALPVTGSYCISLILPHSQRVNTWLSFIRILPLSYDSASVFSSEMVYTLAGTATASWKDALLGETLEGNETRSS